MEYHSARKRTKLIIKATGMNFKNTMLKRKKPDPKKSTYYMTTFIWKF